MNKETLGNQETNCISMRSLLHMYLSFFNFNIVYELVFFFSIVSVCDTIYTIKLQLLQISQPLWQVNLAPKTLALPESQRA